MPNISRPVNTEAADDYLKAILYLSGPGGAAVTSSALADTLGVRPASVTGMLKKLSTMEPPLVRYEKHHGVSLSQRGRKRALEILRHHRLLERFLHDALGYAWDEVHEEAERLEHYISEKLEDRIAAKLGDPQVDPHGHAIPERNGALPDRLETSLSKWACGVPAVISSVSDRDSAELREVKRLGLLPGLEITVRAGVRRPSLLLEAGKERKSVRVSKKMAAHIYVIAANAVS
jgi:DtxR family Mn-dependent transcriptional regulator